MNHGAWFKQAESDLAAARLLSEQMLHSQAIWLCSQAVEKGHKALLAALGLGYQERHFKQLGHDTAGIARLLPENLQIPNDPSVAERLAALSRRAARARYPEDPNGVAPCDDLQDSAEEIQAAEVLVGWCREKMPRAVRAAEAMLPRSSEPA